MIKKRLDRESEVRTNMRGGPGEINITHYFKKDEISGPCRLCAELVLAPGAGIGLHEHANEDEMFIIQQGKGVVTDNDKEVEVTVGDCIITGGGSSHSVKNTGNTDLVITAVIVQYS
ncbi:MAG: cupin domain-containing protein [PVC group bacterium]|nr:cupin domain-containing protein [PVC group bacterium]